MVLTYGLHAGNLQQRKTNQNTGSPDSIVNSCQARLRTHTVQREPVQTCLLFIRKQGVSAQKTNKWGNFSVFTITRLKHDISTGQSISHIEQAEFSILFINHIQGFCNKH